MTIQDIVHDDDVAVYKTLLESTRAIPWKIDWATLRFAYVGPQIEELLGWAPESWMTVQDWADRMHPEDRSWVFDFCVSQSMAGVNSIVPKEGDELPAFIHRADQRLYSAKERGRARVVAEGC